MRGSLSPWRRRARRLVVSLAAPLFVSFVPHSVAVAAPPPAPAVAAAPAAPATITALDLAAARAMAVDKRPDVAAARTDLAIAVNRAATLDKIHLAGLIARDLPVRKKQAAVGVQIAQAGVVKAEAEARFAATYTYLAALYAQEQLQVADDAKTRLTDLRDLAKTALEGGNRKDVAKQQVDLANAYLQLVEGRRQEAVQGYQRALAGLREALGVGPDYPIVLSTAKLPDVAITLDRDQVVQLAVARRGELAQAALGERVYCLEIDAQRATCMPMARTFASGSDIHAQVLPAPSFDPDYKPGALAPEMPVSLNGMKSDRVQQARDYHTRAGAVADKTRNLVALEAEDAYLRFKQFDDEAPKLDKAAAAMEEYSSDITKKFVPNVVGIPTVEDLLGAGVRAVQVRVDAKQVRFRRLAALADLERATAGGVDAGFDGK